MSTTNKSAHDFVVYLKDIYQDLEDEVLLGKADRNVMDYMENATVAEILAKSKEEQNHHGLLLDLDTFQNRYMSTHVIHTISVDIPGKHDPHKVIWNEDGWHCDCKLFHGEDKFGYDQDGNRIEPRRECSHTMAVRGLLWQIDVDYVQLPSERRYQQRNSG